MSDPATFCAKHATHTLYLVEVRCAGIIPVTFRDTTYGQAWRRIGGALPCHSALYPEDALHDIYPYEMAMAIAWAVLADSHATGHVGLQVRVVEAVCRVDYEARRGAELAPLEWMPAREAP